MPNLYPAFASHEVVVHTPRHAGSLAELGGDELDRVAETWRARAGLARVERAAAVQLIVNEGHGAGASIPHTHSQLVRLDGPPPVVERLGAGDCGVCEVLRQEAQVVSERDGVVLLVPLAARTPYELLAAPAAHEPDAFDSDAWPAAVSLLAEGIRRLHAVEGPAPLNAWLHTCAFGAADGHWHLEAVPRLHELGGFELGAGIWIDVVAPEDAAEALRAARYSSSPSGSSSASSGSPSSSATG